MARYLIQGSYTAEGLRGLMKDGGTARRKAVEQLVASLGGIVEAMYFAFGEDDFVILVEGTDNITQAAGNMMVAASGAAKVRTTVLLTPEEIDLAAKKGGAYRPPGT
jgi:uncharacterized protein with GYD domain